MDGAACSLVRQPRLRLMNQGHLPLGQAAWVTPSALQRVTGGSFNLK